jgi:DNA-binding NarL/FixJ family response regulator
MEIRGERCTLWLYQDISERRHSELELADAIEAVMKDASWFQQLSARQAGQPQKPGAQAGLKGPADLSPREREVLGLICEGLDDKAIAQRLSLSGNTVRNHVASIYGKIGVNRRAAAIAWARERGLV